MIINNLDHVPGKKVGRILGITFGYARGKKNDGKDSMERLFNEALDIMVHRGEDLSSDAILKVDGKITRDHEGRPEIMLIGTAVELVDKGEGKEISLSINGDSSNWTLPPATPTSDVVRMINDRSRNDRAREKERKDIYDLADEIGISYDKAKLLMDNDIKDLETISDTSSKDIAEIDGINPTQARILVKKARELLDEERGL